MRMRMRVRARVRVRVGWMVMEATTSWYDGSFGHHSSIVHYPDQVPTIQHYILSVVICTFCHSRL
jgi:hypothetical protein